MGEILKSPRVVKSGVPERVSISCPTCGTRHDLTALCSGGRKLSVSAVGSGWVFVNNEDCCRWEFLSQPTRFSWNYM